MIRKDEFAGRISSRCQELGIPINVFERNVGYSPSMVSRWSLSSDDYTPLTKLQKICDELRVSADWLLGRPPLVNQIPGGGTSGKEAANLCERLKTRTLNCTLQWTKLSSSEMNEHSIPEMHNDLPIATVWEGKDGGDSGGIRFIFCLYCEDILDDSEEISCLLFIDGKHSIPPVPVLDPESDLQALYVTIVTQAILTA